MSSNLSVSIFSFSSPVGVANLAPSFGFILFSVSVNKDVPASNAQIVNHTTNEIYENFVKSEPGVFINDVGLEEGHGERSDWAKRAFFFGISYILEKLSE